MYRIYALIDPTNEEIRYYGKTQLGTVECRLRQHLVDLRSRGHLHVYRWISKILKLGLMPNVKELFVFDTEVEADECEKKLIAEGRIAGLRLTNIHDGGTGGTQPEEIRKLTGQKISDKYKDDKFYQKIKDLRNSDTYINTLRNSIFDNVEVETRRQANIKKRWSSDVGLVEKQSERQKLRMCNPDTKRYLQKMVTCSNGLTFDSITDAAKYFEVSATYIRKILKNGGYYKKYDIYLKSS